LRVAGLLIGLALVGCGDNQPPSMGLIDDQVVSVGDQLRVELLGQDPDGDVLGWGLVGLGAGAEIVPQTASTALLLWSPALSDTEPGGKVYQATVTAADGRGGVVLETFDVTVQPAYGVPVFDLPSGVVLNLAETDALNLDVKVKDDDSSKLEIFLDEGPEGAVFQQSGNKKGTLFWEPTQEQRSELVHRVVLSASDESHPVVDHVLLVLLVNTGAVAGCPGSVPTVTHDSLPDTVLGGGEIPVTLTATDLDSYVDRVYLHWGDDPVAGGFTNEAMDQTQEGGDEWTAEIPTEELEVPLGGKLIHYYVEAYDNDDPTGHDCDRAVRWPKTGYAAFAVYGEGDPNSCVDDAAEPDDTLEKAVPLVPGAYPGRRLCGGSPDHALITTPEGGEIVARVVRVPSHGPVSVRLLNTNGTPVDAASGDSEILSVSAEATGQDYIVEVDSSDSKIRLTYALELSVLEAPCTADAFEPNDGPGEATGLGTGSWPDLQVCTEDSDWFRFDLEEGETVEIAITFQHQFGDLDLALRDVTGSAVLSAAASESSYEVVAYTAPNAMSVMARVTGYQGNTNSYRLDATKTTPDGSCPEDVAGLHVSPVTALVLFSGYYQNLVACPSVPDWFAVDLNGGETVTVQIVPGESGVTTPGGPLTVELYSDSSASPVATATAAQGQPAAATWTLTAPGRLSYRVSANVSTAYSMDQWIQEPAGPCQPDRLEPNNDATVATVVDPGVNSGIITWLHLCDNDDYDVFSVHLEALQTLVVMTSHEEGWGYTDATITRADGNYELFIDWDVGVLAEVLAEEAGTYIVSIEPWECVALAYDIGFWVE